MTRSAVAELDRVAGTSSVVAGTMDETENGRRKPARQPTPKEASNVDHAFDLWLQRGLHQLYDMVAREPLPPELLRLIEESRSGKPEAK